MDLMFGVLALLPLGLFSFFGRHRRSDAGILPLIGALAPVVAKGVMSLVGHKQKKSAEKKQAAYDLAQAQQAEAQRKAEWEAAQNSPAANMKRMGFSLQLGRLLGGVGGRDKAPPSLVKALDAARAMPTYSPGSSYIPQPTSGAGIWDVLGGAGEALSYLDTSKFKGPPKVPGGNMTQNSTDPLLSTLQRKPIQFPGEEG